MWMLNGLDESELMSSDRWQNFQNGIEEKWTRKTIDNDDNDEMEWHKHEWENVYMAIGEHWTASSLHTYSLLHIVFPQPDEIDVMSKNVCRWI